MSAALQQLSLIEEISPAPRFDGKTYDAEQDGARLSTQLVATRELMSDGAWRNLAQIALSLRKSGLHVTEASLSARLRDLRKAKFGGYNVERRRLVGGLWEYRVLSRAVCLFIAFLALVLSAHAQEFPDAPLPVISSTVRPIAAPIKHVDTKDRVTDYSLWFGVVAVHALDWASTEECERRPATSCHEAELPDALVKSPVGFALFKGAVAFSAIEGQRLLEKHGHRKLAYIAQSVHIGLVLKTDIHNYQVNGTTAVAPARQTINPFLPTNPIARLK